MNRGVAGLGLAVLLVASPAPAVTCARDSAPAATLLLPYFRVSRNGVTSMASDIPAGGVDTLFRVVNTGTTGLVVKVEVWSKYGAPLLGFNVPMTARDSFEASMRDVLNGRLNVNSNTQGASISSDPCGINQLNGVYSPSVGFGASTFIRFANPNAVDSHVAISRYATPAFTGSFRQNVWDSLDESHDLTTFTDVNQPGVLDDDHPGCAPGSDGTVSGDFSGYVTFDVVNYCTNFQQRSLEYYANDAIATRGWSVSGYTPNALIGSYKYLDQTCDGNSAYQPMVAVEFDQRVNWLSDRSFYSRFNEGETVTGTVAPEKWRFRGDGREPLGKQFGIEYYDDAASSLKSWITVWRADLLSGGDDLCSWWLDGGPAGSGFADTLHQVDAAVYDGDANVAIVPPPPPPRFLYLQTQRLRFPQPQLNPALFTSGWVSLLLQGTSQHAQATVDTEQNLGRSGSRAGFRVQALQNQFDCSLVFTEVGSSP